MARDQKPKNKPSAPCSQPQALSPKLFALCSLPLTLRSQLHALCSLLHALRSAPQALCSSLCAPCSSLHALSSAPLALRPLLSAPRSLLKIGICFLEIGFFRIRHVKRITTFEYVKCITALFALFLLVLAMVPCTDTHSGPVSDDELSMHVSNQDEHNHGDESCSPFCTCQCCSVHVTFSELPSPLVFRLAMEDVVHPQAIGTPLQANVPVWQPPKV